MSPPGHLAIAAGTLRLHEGRSLKPYRCTSGRLSIGVGRNLDAKGVSDAECEVLFANDLADAEADALAWLGAEAWARLDDARRAVAVDMAFNMGLGTLREFGRTRRLILAGEWEAAAAAMLDSRWAGQVGERARRLAAMMEGGRWTT